MNTHGKGLLKAVMSMQMAKRTIFPIEYLGMSRYIEARDRFRADISKSPSLSGLTTTTKIDKQCLLSVDVRKVFFMAKNKEGVEEASKTLYTFVNKSRSQNMTSIKMNRYLTSDFLLLCHNLQVPGPAKTLFREQEFLDRLRLMEDQNRSQGVQEMCLKYVQLLYNHNEHEEVISFMTRMMSNFPDCNVPFMALTVVMASCYKLNTPESFAKATEFINQAQQQDEKIRYLGRSGCIYALHAISQSQYEDAYEILLFVRDCNNKSNLQVLILAKMGRIEDALRVMASSIKETDDPSLTMSRVKFSKQAVLAITEQVDQLPPNEEETDEIKKKVSIVFNNMDSVAQIIPDSMEDLVLSEIRSRNESSAVDSVTRQFRRPINKDSFSKDLRRSMV